MSRPDAKDLFYPSETSDRPPDLLTKEDAAIFVKELFEGKIKLSKDFWKCDQEGGDGKKIGFFLLSLRELVGDKLQPIHIDLAITFEPPTTVSMEAVLRGLFFPDEASPTIPDLEVLILDIIDYQIQARITFTHRTSGGEVSACDIQVQNLTRVLPDEDPMK